MRVLLVQWAGDFREAYYRLASGGDENYRGQRFVVDQVGDLAKRFGNMAQLTYFTETEYAEALPSGVEAIGLGFRDRVDRRRVIERIAQWKPTHLVQRCISPDVLRWACRSGVRTILLCAESRDTRGLRNWWRNRKIARALNHPGVEWCCNHQINSARWLFDIGVSADKIIPFDFAYAGKPEDYPAKVLEKKGDAWTIGFVGPITESKGVPEVLQAVSRLVQQNVPVRVRLAGAGDIDRFKAVAEGLGIGGRAEFLGGIANPAALQLMHEADVVIVPSRHEYTEAFPFTILEAFLSRTPLIASDHPMFQSKVRPGISGLMFPAKNAVALGECIKQLLGNPALYRKLSENSAAAWHAMTIPAQFGEVARRWLEDTPESREWLHRHRLSSGMYR